jgi:uncharacterized SAM-binding protein YcdF (DUF218 family)
VGRAIGWLLAIIGFGVLAWAIGFVWFYEHVEHEHPVRPMPHADGIVVLTGGPDRVKRGLELLMSGAAPRLLISGAGPGTHLGDFTPRDGIDAVSKAAAISLGHRAATTRGNARETARWVLRHHIQSAIVVTADYHMVRALAELHRHLPGVRLIADPVRRLPRDGALDARQWKLVAAEYTKYLLVRCGLGGFAAHHIEGHL